MKLPGLIDLIFISMLASTSTGEGWNISVHARYNATLYSDVTINCTFFYPLKYRDEDVQIYWKKRVKSVFPTGDADPYAFIFHPNTSLVLEKYRGKTKLITSKPEPIENALKGNCSLKICNITENEQSIYVRVVAKDEKDGKYSFVKNLVSISVYAPGDEPVSLQPDFGPSLITEKPTPSTDSSSSISWYPAVFGSVAALFLIIICVTGIVFYMKHKRAQSFTREESGYYANFSRSSSNQAESDASCKKQGNKKLPEVKAIDEPIYINTEAPPVHTDHSMDHTDNIYANVDYSR